MGKRRLWSTPALTAPADYGLDRKRIFEEVHDALIAVGLTQAMDTGQLADFSSVTSLATSGRNYYGYRIYQINDALSIESPVFLKMDFWGYSTANTSFASLPDIAVSIGNGTNGAGVLSAATTPRSMFPNADPLSNSGGVFASGSVPSFAYSGGGITWLVLKAGFAAGNSSASNIARPDMGGVKGRMTMFAFFIARPIDDSGAMLPGAAIGVTSGGPIISSSALCFDKIHHYFLSCVGGLGTVSETTASSSRIAADVAGTVGAKAVIAAAYGRFDGIMRRLGGVATIPANAVNAMDTVDIAIAGVVQRELVCPHPGLHGLNRLDSYRHSGTGKYGSSEFDTLLLAWDGETV